MKRVLIIGVTGQDGALLAQSLRARKTEYLGVGRRGVVAADGSLVRPGGMGDSGFARDVVRSYSPTHVFYLAAHHHSSQEDRGDSMASLWETSLQVQVLNLVQVLEALRTEAPEARLFYASSSHIFGWPAVSPQDETTPRVPVNVYGLTKVAGMEACRHYREQHGLFASTGILYNHESVYRKESFLSKKVIRAAWAIQHGLQKELVLGDLSARVDWGYAPDYVDAMVRVLQLDEPDEYVVATGAAHTVREFVELAFAGQGLDYREWVRENPALIQRAGGLLVGNANKLRHATGWTPAVSFPEMIRLLGDQNQNLAGSDE